MTQYQEILADAKNKTMFCREAQNFDSSTSHSSKIECLINLVMLVISVAFLVYLWGHFICHKKDYVNVSLPCAPLEIVAYHDKVERFDTRKLWCSSPLVKMDPQKYDCSTLNFTVFSTAVNVTCSQVFVTYWSWYSETPTYARSRHRSYPYEVRITRAFAFKCAESDLKTPFVYAAPVDRSITEENYPLDSHERWLLSEKMVVVPNENY